MAENSKIEWTDATWQPITGCTLVSEGCKHCYAATLAAGRLQHHPSRAGLARRNAAGEAKFTGEVRFNEQWLDQPLRWKRPRRIFVCAHSDLFHESVPDEWIDRVFAVMALASQHTFQVLTKRPERMRAYLRRHDCSKPMDTITDAAFSMNCAVRGYRGLGGAATWPLPNVWLGTSVEDQTTADARIPHLLATPAAVRFLSVEPMLGPVDLQDMQDGWFDGLRGFDARGTGTHFHGLDLVIVGGESGPHARPMHPDWARSLRDQCNAAGVAFHFKQWGGWAPLRGGDGTWPTDTETMIRLRPDGTRGDDGWPMQRVGKKHAGRLLDGREWNEMPGKAVE